MDRVDRIRAAAASVEAWISRSTPAGWLEPRAGGWTDKDLLGHLAAWSDLLMDQADALEQGRPDAVEAVDVHAWNAAQIAKRRGWTADATIAAWRQAVQRVNHVIGGCSLETRSRRWPVTWASQPVCIDDLLDLWLVHLDQHKARLSRSSAPCGAAVTDRR